MAVKIINYDFTNKLCEALGLSGAYVRRMVIDTGNPGDAITIYTESFASDKLLQVDWSALKGLDIEVIDVSTMGGDSNG